MLKDLACYPSSSQNLSCKFFLSVLLLHEVIYICLILQVLKNLFCFFMKYVIFVHKVEEFGVVEGKKDDHL